MSFNPASLLPLGVKLGELVRSAVEQYAFVKASGGEVDADSLAVFLLAKMDGWEPVIAGRRVFDAETRTAFSRAIAGIAFNFSRGA